MKLVILSLIVLTFLFDAWLSILNYRNKDAEIPEEVKDVYDQDAYQKWLQYNMENFRLSMISRTIRLIIIISLLIFRVFPIFNDIAIDLTNSIHLQTLIFLGIYFIIDFVIGIFFSYYKQFTIEEKYGFNKSTKKTFVFDKIKVLILSIIFGGGLIYLLSLLYHNVGDLFYIYAWISIVVIILIINLLYVKLIVPIFNKLRPLDEGELKDKIINFANKVGYEITKISIIDASKRSTKLNAFFSGFGKFKQVVLYDTLIEKMNSDQIVSVLAHEIGHAKHKHIIKNIFIMMITISLYLAVLLFSVKSDSVSTAFGFDNAHFGFGLIIFMLLISPISIILEAIVSRISRKFEYVADHYASVNGYKVEMQEALKILGRENYDNLTPHPLFVALKYSHPPIAYRIRAIRKIED
ncbi:M48 family metallopeptidase [Mycoplasmatota bacterium]|nr:M48 family metallopeptidase [Mycoplasmatota bacterium]